MHRIVMILLLALAGAAQAEVYRYVNEEGVVVFTDEPPSPDAQPIEVAPITVIETRTPDFVPPPTAEDAAGETGPYAGVTLASPRPEETFQGTGNSLVVRMASPQPLRPGDRMVVYLDGVRQGEFPQFAVKLDGIPRGTHTVSASIVSETGAVVAETDPVTFYMKQHSVQHNQGPMAFPSPVGPPG